MSKLSDFFPKSVRGGSQVTVIMVGGGGGAGTCSGAGGGGYFYGVVPVTPGVSYPVVIGTGGSPGNPASCNTTAGLGNPGNPSRFGRYEALGGGGGATICGGGSSFCGLSYSVPGAPGGHAGSVIGRGCTPFLCGSYCNTDHFFVTGSSQRSVSPNGYCGALSIVSRMGYPYQPARNLFSSSSRVRRSTAVCGQPACTAVCPEFFGVCLASIPYTISPASTIPSVPVVGCVCTIRAGCSRFIDWACGCPTCPFLTSNVIGNCPNTGNGALCSACNGDSGVVLVAYPCAIPAATSFPGATDCSPVSIPQNGYRTYKFTSSGSFTL